MRAVSKAGLLVSIIRDMSIVKQGIKKTTAAFDCMVYNRYLSTKKTEPSKSVLIGQIKGH